MAMGGWRGRGGGVQGIDDEKDDHLPIIRTILDKPRNKCCCSTDDDSIISKIERLFWGLGRGD